MKNPIEFLKKINQEPKSSPEVKENTVYVLFGIPKYKDQSVQDSKDEIVVQIFSDYNNAFDALERAKTSKFNLHQWQVSRMKIN